MASRKKLCPACGAVFRKSGGRALVFVDLGRLERLPVCARCYSRADRIVSPKLATRCLECAAAAPKLCLGCAGRVKVRKARPRKSTAVGDYLRGDP